MRTLTNGTLTVVAFDADVYKQEKNVLECSVSGTATVKADTEIEVRANGSLLATYHTNTSGVVVIDLSDYIRVNSSKTLTITSLYDATQTGSVELSYTVAGLLSPASILVPETAEAAAARDVSNVANNWCMPRMILQPIGQIDALVYGCTGLYSLRSTAGLSPNAYYLRISNFNMKKGADPKEFIANAYQYVFGMYRAVSSINLETSASQPGHYWYSFMDILYSTQAPATAKRTELLVFIENYGDVVVNNDVYVMNAADGTTVEELLNAASNYNWLYAAPTTKQLGLMSDDLEMVQVVHVTPRLCGRIYADVRWVSAVGKNKRLTWEVRDRKQATGDVVEIATIGSGFDVRKGRTDGFSLCLDGLTAFDVWYYGDIVMSSKVEVSFDGTNWQTVKVETKDVSVPDGDAGEAHELKVQVIFAEYDAVAM